jgi:hypothetical protein
MKDYIMSQHTDDTDYGYEVPMPVVNEPFMSKWMDRIVDVSYEQSKAVKEQEESK